jgi:hypothetical protein
MLAMHALAAAPLAAAPSRLRGHALSSASPRPALLASRAALRGAPLVGLPALQRPARAAAARVAASAARRPGARRVSALSSPHGARAAAAHADAAAAPPSPDSPGSLLRALLRKLQTPALALALAAVVLTSLPGDALAARSSGRMGGSSFSSRRRAPLSPASRLPRTRTHTCALR